MSEGLSLDAGLDIGVYSEKKVPGFMRVRWRPRRDLNPCYRRERTKDRISNSLVFTRFTLGIPYGRKAFHVYPVS